jgi:class 3 adenylate cyclase
MSLSDAANDALFWLQQGKSPNEEIVNGIRELTDGADGDDEIAANALLRIILGAGAESTHIELLKAKANAAEQEALLDLLDKYAEADSDPKAFDRSQLATLMFVLVGVEPSAVVDPSSRTGEKVTKASTEEDIKSCIDGLVKFLDSTPWQITVGFMTAWALFATDIALWVLPKSADEPLAVFTLIVFLGFTFEFLSNIFTGRDYGSDVGDLFFWLDFIGTVSLLPDFLILFGYELEVPDNAVLARVARAARIGARLSRLTKVFRVKDGDSAFTSMLKQKLEEEGEEEASADEAAADVSSQVGAKVADGISKKVVLLVIILLVFVPIFTYQEPTGGQKQTKEEAMHMLFSMRGTRANVGKSMMIGTCNRACTRVATGIGSIGGQCSTVDGQQVTLHSKPGERSFQNIPQVPFGTAVDGSQYGKDCANDGSDCGMPAANDGTIHDQWCHQGGKGGSLTTIGAKTLMTNSQKNVMRKFLALQGDPVIYFNWDRDDLTGGSIFFEWTTRIDELRKSEIRKYGDQVDEYQLKAGEHKSLEVKHRYDGMEIWVDLKDKTSDEAFLTIIYMWFVIVIFAVSSLVFMADVQSLVIEPVEGMTSAMQMIATSLIDLGGDQDSGANEANYIETTVLKIVSLLHVSFGDAGRRVINRNTGEEGGLAATPGEAVQGVYGMSDIRQFTATTEALNQDIVLFVNEFGNICHESCEQHYGAPNKNVGDAFLCVWVEGRRAGNVNLCDRALMAYRQAVQKIRQSENLATLCKRREIKERFPPKDQPFGRYFPEMGFGLHYGDSIEGLIGTERKMDASYLGGDVDLADKLEEQTKEYKTPILMTEAFYNRLSPKMQASCRLIDRVSGGAAAEPFKLYAATVASIEAPAEIIPKPKFANFFDPKIEEDIFPDPTKTFAATNEPKAADRLIAAIEDDPDAEGAEDGAEVQAPEPEQDQEDQEQEVDEPEPEQLVNGNEISDEQLEQLAQVDQEWNAEFEKAVETYIDGNWTEAMRALDRLLLEKAYDGPANKLKSFMMENGSRAPRDWQGFAVWD